MELRTSAESKKDKCKKNHASAHHGQNLQDKDKILKAVGIGGGRDTLCPGTKGFKKIANFSSKTPEDRTQ